MSARFVTDFADQAVVLPLALAVTLGLLAMGWRRGALAWGGGVAGVLAVMLLLKILVFACGWRLFWPDLVSPSGHTAAAAVVYGGLIALFLPRGLQGTLAAFLAGGGVALMIGLTRLCLHVHTLSDVAVGAAVGIGGAVLLRHAAGDPPRRRLSPGLAVLALGVMLLFHGHRLDAEARIRGMAWDIRPLTICRK